ncbi:MAG: PAS domain-containing sensor histidine kinase [Propionibacteriaceae bacterium]|nr:PAS domain-containing sensor histidine kinase [Propionibacteriaceae bacterium]
MFPRADDFRAMTMLSETGILIHEAESKNIRWANPAACRMFGFSLAELRPLKAHHMSAQEQQFRRELGVGWLQEAVDNGVARRIWKYRAKDGEDFLTDAVARLVQFGEGPMVMVQFRNISQEVELQHQLTVTSDYLSRIMVQASAAILLLDDSERIADASHFVSELLDRERGDLVGKRLSDLGVLTLVAQRHDDPDPATPGPAEPETPIEMMLEVERSDGGKAWLSAMLEHVAHDGIRSTTVILRDITAKVEMQRENELQQAHLQYLARYNAMGDMAMTLAHELGQPLAAATNYLSGLKGRLAAGRVDPDQIRYGLDKARQQLDRTAEIVASVRRYVQRIESTAAPEDLNAIMRESLFFCELRAAEKGIEVTADYAPGTLPITGEHILIGQAIINFCFNAIDEAALACTAEKHVHVRSFAEGDWVCVSVTDWGRGMARAQAGSMRGPTATTSDRLQMNAFSSKQDGAGIGLVLSQRIVERHFGEVIVEDNLFSGTIVTVRLPRAGSTAD